MEVVLSIIIVGNINAGKSSLINSLLEKEVACVGAKGGVTQDSESFNLKTYSLSSGKLSLEIIDTPGLSEVDGERRENIAIDAVTNGDLIIFVVNSDLLDTEKVVIERLTAMNKPVLLVFNQIDRYTEQQKQDIYNSLVGNVANMIGEQDIFLTAASPTRKILIISESGEELEEERTGLPDVSTLKSRIEFIAHSIGKHIDHIAGYHEQWIKANLQLTKTKRLKEKSSSVVFDYSVGIGLTTAVNPVPLIDMVGGAAGVAMMIKQVANIYDISITTDEATKLAKDMLQEVVITMGIFTALVFGAGSLVKMVPFVGWAVGGATQAASVAFAVLIIGYTVNDYFANQQKWESNNSLKESLEKKMASLDKDTIMRQLKKRINSKIMK